MPISQSWLVKPSRSPRLKTNGEPSASLVRRMSRARAQPSTPCSSRTLNQSVRRYSTSIEASRSTTWNTGYPRPGPSDSSRYGSLTKTCSSFSWAAACLAAFSASLSFARAVADREHAKTRASARLILRSWRERVVVILGSNIQPLRKQAQFSGREHTRMRRRVHHLEETRAARTVGVHRVRQQRDDHRRLSVGI